MANHMRIGLFLLTLSRQPRAKRRTRRNAMQGISSTRMVRTEAFPCRLIVKAVQGIAAIRAILGNSKGPTSTNWQEHKPLSSLFFPATLHLRFHSSWPSPNGIRALWLLCDISDKLQTPPVLGRPLETWSNEHRPNPRFRGTGPPPA